MTGLVAVSGKGLLTGIVILEERPGGVKEPTVKGSLAELELLLVELAVVIGDVVHVVDDGVVEAGNERPCMCAIQL